MGLDQFKEKYPQYNDWDDQDLAGALYEKYGESSGVARNEFMADIGRPQYMDATPSETETNMMKAGTVKSVAQEIPVQREQQDTTLASARYDYLLSDDLEDARYTPPEQTPDAGLARGAYQSLQSQRKTSDLYTTPLPATLGKSIKEGTKDIVRNHYNFLSDSQAAIDPGKEVDVMKSVEQGRVPSILASTLTPGAREEYWQAKSKGLDPKETMIGAKTERAKMFADAASKWAADPKYFAGTGLEMYVNDFTRMVPQITAQVTSTLLAGPTAGLAFMGTQIAGGTMEALSNEGVKDPVVRFKAGMFNAGFQAPMEQLAMGKIMKAWNPSASAAKVIRDLLEAGGTEWGTETLQKIPEWMAEVWAKGEQDGIPAGERLNKFFEGLPNAIKEGAYEGLVAAPAGVLIGGLGAKAQYKAYEFEKQIERFKKDVAKYNEELVAKQKEVDEGKLDPRLMQEMEKRALFGDQFETPGGPRTFEGQGPGGTVAPVQEGEIQAPPETVEDLNLNQEQEAFSDTKEDESIDINDIEDIDDTIDPYDQTMASDDAALTAMFLEQDEQDIESKYEDLNKAFEEADTSLDFGEVELDRIRQKENIDPIFDGKIIVEDEVSGNARVINQVDIKPGIVAIDTASSEFPTKWTQVEQTINAKRKNGSRAWRFGFLLDMLQDLGISLEFTAANSTTSESIAVRPDAGGFFASDLVDVNGRYVIALNDKMVSQEPPFDVITNAIAHEMLHAIYKAKRVEMTEPQRVSYYKDLIKLINDVDWSQFENEMEMLKIANPNSQIQDRHVRHMRMFKSAIKAALKAYADHGSIARVNLEEILTYPLTDPFIAKALDKIQVKEPTNKIKTVWDQFIRKVANTLGIKRGSVLREIEHLLSTHIGVNPKLTKSITKQKAAPKSKGYIYKSVNKVFANEVNDILKDYQDVVEANRKLIDKFITMAERATLREATPDRHFIDGEPALMKELGPNEFAKKRFYINKKGKKTRWYTDNDIKNFNTFREAAQELIQISPELVTDIEQAIGEFVKTPEKRMMPKGYVTSIVDGEVIDHPKGWLSPKAKKKAPKKPVKKVVKKAPEKPKTKPKLEPKPKAPPKKVEPKKAKPEAPKKPSTPPIQLTEEQRTRAIKEAKTEAEATGPAREMTISPTDFINLTTGTDKTADRVRSKTTSKNIEDFDPTEWDKTAAPYLVIDENGKVIGHEGRHRAAMYERMGIKKYPILVIGAHKKVNPDSMTKLQSQKFGSKDRGFIRKIATKKQAGAAKAVKENTDIAAHMNDNKWLEDQWSAAAQKLGIAKDKGDTARADQLQKRIDLIKAALFGGGVVETKLPSGAVRTGQLPAEFITEAERQLNEAMPGYDFKLESFYPKTAMVVPWGYGYHVTNPDSALYRTSFALLSETIDPEAVRKQVSEREAIFMAAKEKESTRPQTKYTYEDPQMEKDHRTYRVGVAKDTWLRRTAEFFIGVKNKFREFENISRKKLGQYAEATKELRRLRNYRGIASSKAVAKLGKILNGMNKEQYEVFERLVTMAGFWEQHKINEQRIANNEDPLDVPFDWPKESVEREFKKLVRMAMNDPVLKEAWAVRLTTWNELKNEYSQAMKDVGFNVEDRMKRVHYFRNQVVDYLKAKGPSTVATKKLATPANRSHIRARKGTTKAINLNYIQAEYEVMAQLLYDVQIAKTIKVIKDKFDIVDQLKEEQGEQELENYTIPEGYVAWRPREGSVMYLADTIPSKLFEEAIAKGLKQLKVKTKDISKVLVIGRKHSEMVIPEDLAETLNSYLDSQKKGIVGRFFRAMMTGWKAYQLVSPFRFSKYNLRNMTGDAEAIFVGGQTFSTGRQMFTQAGVDIMKKLLGKKPSAEYAEWVDRGGLESNFTTQEMADILRSPEFKNVTGTTGAVKLFARKVWKLPRTLTDAREQWMRYASYLAFLKKLESGTFKKTDYAASIPEEIDNLRDNRDKAFALSNDLLGAYDRVTEAGDFMRRHVMPFYSFQEVNASRAMQIYRNMAANERLVGAIGRKIIGKTAAKSIMLTLATGRMAVTLMFWSTLLQVFNNLYYPDEEDALTDDLRETAHFYMGPPGSKEIKYFPRVGILGDLLEWGNLQSAPLKLADLLTGRTKLEDAKKEIEKFATKEGATDASQKAFVQLANKLGGMVGPQYKVLFEIGTGQRLFPDITNPKPMDNWKAHIADQFFPRQIGDLIRQRPMAKTWKSDMVSNLYTYKQDINRMAYNATKTRKIKWLRDMGFRGKGYHSSEKATAAYNMSLAFKYGDEVAFKKYFMDYIMLSYGQVKDIGDIMEELDPLYNMTKDQQLLFISTLNKNELKGLELANQHYIEILSGVQFTGGK